MDPELVKHEFQLNLNYLLTSSQKVFKIGRFEFLNKCS